VKTHSQPRQAQCLLACESWTAAQSENPLQRHAIRLLPCRRQALSANKNGGWAIFRCAASGARPMPVFSCMSGKPQPARWRHAEPGGKAE